MQIKSERPAESNDTRRPPFGYRIQKILAKIYGAFFSRGLKYNGLGPDESLEYILQSGKSFIRLADGEAKLMMGGDWPTQWGHPELRKGLWRIFEDYDHKSQYVIGVGNSKLQQSVAELRRQGRHRIWRNPRYTMRRFLEKDPTLPFIESNMFRVGPEQVDFDLISQLWNNKDHIIVVSNSEKYVEFFHKNYPGKQAYHIKSPNKNSYDEFDRMKSEVIAMVNEHQLEEKHFVVLCAAGPAGKVLMHQLCQLEKQYLCYDMGNFFHMHNQRQALETEST